MIRKLPNNDYGKRLNCMSLEEEQVYAEKVRQWLDAQAPLLVQKMELTEARFQDAVQMSAMWNDAECKAWEDGVRLLTSLMGSTETWLPDMIYTIAARRTVRKLLKELSQVKSEGLRVKNEEPAAPETATVVITKPRYAEMTKPKQQEPKPQPDVKPETLNQKPDVVRPKHIDQYVHLLPEKTQKHAEEVKPLLRDLDAARENMRLLMNDKKASPADREKWAKLATNIDTRLRNIYKELDSEWDKLVKSGKVVVDDLGNARVIDNGQQTPDNDTTELAALTKEQRERVRTLRHFLKDTRRGNGRTREEHIKKWKAFYKEMVEIAGPDSVTDKVKEAAQHYGIELPEKPS